MVFSPSLACARQLHLAEDLRELMALGLDHIHFDVMDGHCVPNLCLSLDTARQLKEEFPRARLDVHLMVDDPAVYISQLAELGAEQVSFHPGEGVDAGAVLDSLRAQGITGGIALRPGDGLGLLEPLARRLDFVLVMCVEPGFSGRPFLESSYGKLRDLTAWRGRTGADFRIAVDGGITPEIAARLQRYEIDTQVLGTLFLFGQPDGITAAWREGSALLQPAMEGERR